jgi:hypothetical protein
VWYNQVITSTNQFYIAGDFRTISFEDKEAYFWYTEHSNLLCKVRFELRTLFRRRDKPVA